MVYDKSNFYSNFSGSSFGFVLALLLHAPLYAYISNSLIKLLSIPRFMLDFLVLAIPLFLHLTVIADYAYFSLAILVGIWFVHASMEKHVEWMLWGSKKSILDTSPSSKYDVQVAKDGVNFVSSFRGALVLMTCFCILMVDFKVFPRYHAKTEEEGVSLMDIGIGGYIFSSGLTSRFARRKSTTFFRSTRSCKVARRRPVLFPWGWRLFSASGSLTGQSWW